MATASFSEKVSDDFIQCTICCYNFKKPKILPCLHTFCAHCLQEWVQKNDGENFPCPTCRDQVSLPQNGVEGLKDNFFLASLVKAVTEHHKVRHGQDGLLCTTCDEGKPATSRCSECAEFLCESCESAHRLQRATKGHTLFTFEELKTGKYDGVFKSRKAPPCSKHSGEIMKLYCRTCGTPICNECALFEHRDSQHDLKRIEEVAAEKRKTILDLTPQCQARKQFFQRTEEVQNRLKEQLQMNTEGARQNVHKTVQSLIALVKEEGERLLSCIDSEETSRKKQIDAQIEGAQISLASAKSTCEFAETLAREGGDYEVVSFSQDLTKRLNDLTKPPADTVNFGLANITIDYSVMRRKLEQNIPPLAQYNLPKSTEKELRASQKPASCRTPGNGTKQKGRGGNVSRITHDPPGVEFVHLQQLRHDWFERGADLMCLYVFTKEVRKDTLDIQVSDQALTVNFQTSDAKFLALHEGTTTQTIFCWSIRLFYRIVPDECVYRVGQSTLDITLKKADQRRWSRLEALS